MDFAALLAQAKPPKRQTVAVAAAEDPVVLKTLADAYKEDIANAILCGNEDRIKESALGEGIDISPFSIIHAADEKLAAAAAVAAVREGRADMLMKGLLQTSNLLKAVLDKEHGLRGSGLISHVCVLYSPILDRMLFIADGGMVTYPDLAAKVKILENTVRAAKGMGIACPKVAVLAAVETVNPDMPPTLDAAALTLMNKRGQIKGCVVDGPLAMDLALSSYAAEHKGVKSEVAGQADVLIFPNIESANCAVKVFSCAGHSIFGGVVMGAAAPIVLSSRGDSEQNKLYAIACAAKIAMNS
ncbi:MAG: bifunctional enoyl-CoA hydratase/phosphate acetyltransferase [Clostridiales bacterium]|nr:bifunctional enoyl-CoA hydratase/phosphate acetyltransferase [Clostridiales bacterium]